MGGNCFLSFQSRELQAERGCGKREKMRHVDVEERNGRENRRMEEGGCAMEKKKGGAIVKKGGASFRYMYQEGREVVEVKWSYGTKFEEHTNGLLYQMLEISNG